VDKDGKELEKSKPEVVSPKPKKTVTAAPKPINDKSNPSTNIYDFPEDAENVPSKAEYMASVRESRTKGKVDKTPVKHKATKASQEKDAKEKKEPKSEKKADKKQPKSPEKKEKVKKSPAEQKQIVADVPFWQNELFKPLVYVFGIVSLLSFLYLVLN